MISILRPLRFIAQTLTEETSPRQMSMGIALGMLVGLVPKDNLTAFLCLFVLCASRVNLGLGFASAFVFSWIGAWMDPVSHYFGYQILSAQSLQTWWTWFFDQPITPWTSLNNTIVIGSLVVGLALLFPVYRAFLPITRKYSPRVEKRLKRFKLVQLLWGIELGTGLGEV